jgi:hypothetical protein
MSSDINVAMSTLKRGRGRVPERVEVLSFTPTASGVVTVNGRGKQKLCIKGWVTEWRELILKLPLWENMCGGRPSRGA